MEYPLIELWMSEGDNHRTLVMLGVRGDGQKALIGSEDFGPFDNEQDMATWVWARLRLASGPLAG